MRLLFFSLSLLAFYTMAYAQQSDEYNVRRTPEIIANKQTEMMVRELGITDSLMRDTLYRMHLKFARQREISNTRFEEAQRMQQVLAELKAILPPEKYNAFINKQVIPFTRSSKVSNTIQ